MPSRFKGALLSSVEEIQRLHIYSPIDIFRISISLEKRWLNLNTSTFISTWSVVIVSGGFRFVVVYLGMVYKHSLVSDWVLIFKLIFQGSDSAQSLEFHQHTRRSCLKYLLAHLRGRRRRHTLPSSSRYIPKVCFNGFSLNRIECAQQSKLYSLVINIISL